MRITPILASAGFFAMPAFGLTCGSYDAVKGVLESKYEEQFRVGALAGADLIEFWGNEDTGTWTIVSVDSAGLTCIRADGVGFSFTAPGDLM